MVASACASPPANPAGGALLAVDATTASVSTTSKAPIRYTVAFADHGVRMPQSVFIDDVDRVATDRCPAESGIGIGVAPVLNAVAPVHGGIDASGTLKIDLPGPVIARILITWMAPYMCSGAQQEAKGTSTFTFYPNGRIVRDDVATPSTTALGGPDCGCGGQSAYSFTSFWTFAAAQVVNPDGTALTSGPVTSCAVYSNHMIGVAWPNSSTHVHQTAATSSFVYDWETDAAPLRPMSRGVTSAIMLSEQTAAASCGDVLSDLDDVPLLVNGVTMATDTSGMYVDLAVHTSPVVLSVPGALPRGSAISLNVGDFASVTRSPAVDGDWYAIQNDGDQSIFWFRDGLAAGETITITPR
jgi:hypothetical protein